MQELMPFTRTIEYIPEVDQIFSFQGDDLFSVEEYNTVMQNDYLPKFPLAIVMMNRYQIPFSNEDKERVKRILVATGWLDHFVDESPDRSTALQLFDQLMKSLNTDANPDLPSWARPELLTSIKLLRNAIRDLPEKDINIMIEKALRIGELGKMKASAVNIKPYIAIVAEEGGLSGDLAVEVLSSEAKANINYPKLYTANRKAVTAANLLDAMLDLNRDFNDGITHVGPSPLNRLILTKEIVKYLPATLKGLGLKGIITAIKVGFN